MNDSTIITGVAVAAVVSVATAVAMRGSGTWMVMKDILLTGLGIIAIWSQIRLPHPNGLVLGTGLALCVPTVWQHVKALLPGGTEGPGKEGDKNGK